MVRFEVVFLWIIFKVTVENMMRLVIFVCCLNSMILCFSPIVRVEEGELVGTSYELPNGRIVDAFLGVPYAAPPISEHRFKVRV